MLFIREDREKNMVSKNMTDGKHVNVVKWDPSKDIPYVQ